MPRRLASSWTSCGGVAHSGRPRARWTPSLDSCDAVEWQCRSARLTSGVIGAPWSMFCIGLREGTFACNGPSPVTIRQLVCDGSVKASRAPRSRREPDLVLTIDLQQTPFSLTVRRGRRTVLRHVTAWVADGEIRDRYVQLTEGVIPHEELAPRERVSTVAVTGDGALALVLDGGRRATLRWRVEG